MRVLRGSKHEAERRSKEGEVRENTDHTDMIARIKGKSEYAKANKRER